MDKKMEISGAARTLFSQFGLKKVTTDDIAKKARVSKATVYKYYRNKYQIFDEIVEGEIKRSIRAINEAVDRKTHSVDKLRAHLNTKLDLGDTLTSIYKMTQETSPEFHAYWEQIRIRFMKEEREIIQKILEIGIVNNELDVRDVYLTSHAIQIILQSVEDASALQGMNIDGTRLRDQTLDLIINGVRRRDDNQQSGRNVDQRIRIRSPLGHA